MLKCLPKEKKKKKAVLDCCQGKGKEFPVNHPADTTHPFKEHPKEQNTPSFGDAYKIQEYLN